MFGFVQPPCLHQRYHIKTADERPYTAAASLHATSKGFILPQTLPAIEEEREEDKKEPIPAEKLLDEKEDSSVKNTNEVSSG